MIDQDTLQQKAHDLLKEMKEARASFSQSTQSLIAEIDTETESAEKELEDIDQKLTQFEKDASDQIDEAVLELLLEE